MGRFTENSDLVFCAGRTLSRGNWVSVDLNGFEIKLSDHNSKPLSQRELKEKCIKCLNTLFG